MKYLVVLLLSSPALAQDVPYYNRAVESEQDIGAINRNFQEVVEMDRRHNLTNGGTINGSLAVDSITWPDGTVQVSSPASTAGSLALTGLVFGNASNSNYINTDQVAYYARSVDGATQSSGCVVAVIFQNTGAINASLVFTSTTSLDGTISAAGAQMGVLLESCAPSAYCKVGLSGIYRVITAEALGVDEPLDFSATRCRVGAGAIGNITDFARRVHPGAVSSGQFFWLRVD